LEDAATPRPAHRDYRDQVDLAVLQADLVASVVASRADKEEEDSEATSVAEVAFVVAEAEARMEGVAVLDISRMASAAPQTAPLPDRVVVIVPTASAVAADPMMTVVTVAEAPEEVDIVIVIKMEVGMVPAMTQENAATTEMATTTEGVNQGTDLRTDGGYPSIILWGILSRACFTMSYCSLLHCISVVSMGGWAGKE
jgi:hypothetical protein